MGELKVSQMQEAANANDNDYLMIIQDGVNKKARIENVRNNISTVDNLESTSQTSALSANQGKVLNEKIVGTVLYEDETGTLGNVTLNDSAENYDYIEIYYRMASRSDSIKIIDFDSKNLVLSIVVASTTTVVVLTKQIKISGQTITKVGEAQYLRHITAGDTFSETDSIHIYKVVGYKY